MAITPGIISSTKYPFTGTELVINEILSGGGVNDFYNMTELDLWPSMSTQNIYSVSPGFTEGGGTFFFGFTYKDRYSWAATIETIVYCTGTGAISSLTYYREDHSTHPGGFSIESSTFGFTNDSVFSGRGQESLYTVIVKNTGSDLNISINGSAITSGSYDQTRWWKSPTYYGSGNSNTHPDAIIHYTAYTSNNITAQQETDLINATNTEFGP